MNFIYQLFKKFFFLLFFGTDIEAFDAEISINDKNPQDNLENEDSISHKKTILTYLKFVLMISLSFISLIILINILNYDADLEQLQNLLNELATTVEWNLYRDIFLNVQKILYSNANKTITLYVLQEIHTFFLSNTDQVHDTEKFDKIMKEIISLLSKED